MCGKKVKHKVFVSDKTYKKKDIKKFVWYFPSGNVILVPVNQRICKNCINLKKKNSYSNDTQESHGATYYRKNSSTKESFLGASW